MPGPDILAATSILTDSAKMCKIKLHISEYLCNTNKHIFAEFITRGYNFEV
jgi:hypothetical protein